MEFTVQETFLSEFVSNASNLVEEARVHARPDGLFLQAVDPANVGMTSQTLSDDGFEAWSVDGTDEDHTVLGLDLERTGDIISMGSGELLRGELNNETRKLDWQIGQGLEFTQALIDPDSIRQEPDIPDLDLTARFSVPGREITRAVKAADMVSDHVRIEFDTEEDVAVISAEGDTDDVEVRIDQGRGLEVHESGPGNSLFSLDYLDDMSTGFPSDGSVEIELGEEFPLKMHHEFAEGYGEVTYMLAPRIQSS